MKNRRITLGSLFDGSGGFPLGGVLNGITPVWASEIEPFPIRVTHKRFPSMKHLGDVSKINGGEIEPVDVITFGSPCQNMSVAGKREGLNGSESGLFYQAIRIIKEMRESTNGEYPKFAVWENVPGALSSGNPKGDDFRCVLEEFCKIKDETVSVPRPKDGKWLHDGEIVGDGFSLAWRILDAQYWGLSYYDGETNALFKVGTPQRRKRIYLVADFADERAGEILFERKGVRGNPSESGETREGTADDAAGGAGGSCGVKCLNPWDSQSKRQYAIEGSYPTLDAGNSAGGQAHGVCYKCGSFMGGQGSDAGGIGYSERVSPTLKSVLSGGNTVPDVVCCFQQNQRDEVRNMGEQSGSLSANAGAHQSNYLCYDSRGNGDGVTASNITGDHENRVTDYTNIVISLEGNGTRESHRGDGYHEDDSMYTLNTVEQHSVCYSIDGYAQYADKNPILRASGGDNGGGSEAIVIQKL